MTRSTLSPLGQNSAYPEHYAPDLLFPIPRQEKRQELGLREDALPFVGEDLWNAYEISWLSPRGLPRVAIGTLRVPAHSPCLVESKSLKLYLNSFNQTPFADKEAVAATLARDVGAAAGAPVSVELQELTERPQPRVAYPAGICLDTLDISIDDYALRPEYLRLSAEQGTGEETLYSHLLKSNCLVTGQPDWGTVVIRYRGRPLDREGLLRYIVSFRRHNEFHEQCVERIFTDIQRICAPESLAVWARYTRRGGLDINPFRSSGEFAAPGNLREVRQ